jgi:hypothetical protein
MGTTNWIRRQFRDNVSASDTIPAGVSSGATSFNAADGTTFPDGATGPFIVTLDQGLATEEKVLIQSRSGAAFTVAASGRGYGTGGASAQTHAPNCTILHTIDAQDLDEANQVAVQTLGAITSTGDLLQGSGSHTLARLARGSANSFLQVVGTSLAWTGFGSGQSQPIGSSNLDGSQTTPARSDHAHAGVATFNTRGGTVSLTAADVNALFTANNQMFSGTGSGTGHLVDLLTELETYFASNGQVIVGTGSGTGELFNPFPVSTVVATNETSASTSYTDLATGGPAATVTTGTSALVTITCTQGNAGAGSSTYTGYAVSGASTVGANDARALLTATQGVNNQGFSATYLQTGLTAGSNVFTLKYRVTSGTGSWLNRGITVQPLP